MTITLRFEKIVPSGQALAHHDGKALFCLGPIPGETCEVEIVRDATSFALAKLVRIVEPAAERTSHVQAMPYAPWQTVDYGAQLQLKHDMLSESFQRFGLEIGPIIASPEPNEYRNKLTFALRMIEGKMTMGMYERRSRTFFPTPHGCSLGKPVLNQFAIDILDRLNRLDISDTVESLRLRSSDNNDVVAILLLKKRKKADYQALRVPGLAGVIVRTKDERVWTTGLTELTDTI
jgi:23S rRNA (uracil1939-C5)-methyltransferase